MTTKLSLTVRRVFAAAAILLASTEQASHAALISGSVGFDGTGTVTQVGGPDRSSTIMFNPMTVDIRIGDYNGIPAGTTTNFAPISWSGSGTSAVLTSSNVPEWAVTANGTAYYFSIIALQNATMSLSRGTVTMAGVGLALINGAVTRDPTYLTFSIQGIFDAQGVGQFTFAEVIACNIGPCGGLARFPDSGSALVLLSCALVSVEILRRRWCAVRVG